MAKLLAPDAIRLGFVTFDPPYSVLESLMLAELLHFLVQARLSLVPKRGVTNLHVKHPVLTFGLLALDLLNLSAPGLAQFSIFSLMFSIPNPQVRGGGKAQSKSDRPRLILPGIGDKQRVVTSGSYTTLVARAYDREV